MIKITKPSLPQGKSKKKKSIAIIANFKMTQFHQVEGDYCKIYCNTIFYCKGMKIT
jgi:hypothetical protein